jgi:ATP-binding cassette, subfamily B, bacterial
VEQLLSLAGSLKDIHKAPLRGPTYQTIFGLMYGLGLCIHDDIMRMPMKYETVISEGGSGLSGGQRQRLALARALVHKPAILLLDEATSHLDLNTEQSVEQNLNTLACTRIVIAHRQSSIRDADQILILEGGRIIARGEHDRLPTAAALGSSIVAGRICG